MTRVHPARTHVHPDHRLTAHPGVLCDDRPVNPIDVLTLLLIVVALILGWRSGAIPQISGLIGAIGGGVIAILLLPTFADPLAASIRPIRPIVVLAGLVVAVGIGESLGGAVGRGLARRLGTGLLGAADRTAGAGLRRHPGPADRVAGRQPSRRRARAAPGGDGRRRRRPSARLALFLPPPTEIATGLGGWLDTTGLPDVFVGFEPLPAPPVDRPDDPAARAIAAAAEASTLKVSAATCGLSSVGTGFVVGPSYVLTNAHVVAGAATRDARPGSAARSSMRCPCCSTRPSTSPSSTSTGLRVTALQFAAQDPSRGALGATLGYPGRRTADDRPGGRRRAATRRPAATSTARTASGARSSSSAPRSTGATAAAR